MNIHPYIGVRVMLMVDLGCGENPREGYVGVDIRDIDGIEYPNTDVRNLPFKDNEIDVVRAIHIIEHLPRNEILSVFKEWHRVLKKNGKMLIECPNFLYIATEYMCLQDDDFDQKRSLFEWLYGEQDYEYNYHYACYDYWILEYFLREAGFNSVKLMLPIDYQNLRVIVWK